ncbi:major capsid protein [bacterium]|nr:major capsid protein [bacterium]
MPDTSTVHNDVALTNVSLAYRNPGFIAAEIAPEVQVRRQSNKYFIYDPQRESMRSTTDHRAPGTEAGEVNFDLSSDSYFCDDHALESAIPDEERENADSPLQPEVDRVEFVTEKILLNQEIALAGLLRDATAMPGHDIDSAANRWDDDDIDPLDDIETARAAIVDATQAMPNVLVLPFDVYRKVRHNAKVAERVKYSRLGVVGPKELAELFDVEKVLIPRAVHNTAARGQEPSLETIWGKDALMLHVPQRAGLKCIAPALGFVWAKASASLRGTSVQTWREERRKATMVRVQKYYDLKLVAPAAGYLITNAVS